jgi:periplasmic protein TonB
MTYPSLLMRRIFGVTAGAAAALLAACTSTPVPRGAPPAPPPDSVLPSSAGSTGPRASSAATPREYRKDAASHLYGLNHERIYAGRMPPMLYAIGVLQVDVDARGEITRLNWMRAPRHAPEVVAEIERTVRAAAPFPPPRRMGRVTYTDTWLWDRSGRFQLDTLTEGQD